MYTQQAKEPLPAEDFIHDGTNSETIFPGWAGLGGVFPFFADPAFVFQIEPQGVADLQCYVPEYPDDLPGGAQPSIVPSVGGVSPLLEEEMAPFGPGLAWSTEEAVAGLPDDGGVEAAWEVDDWILQEVLEESWKEKERENRKTGNDRQPLKTKSDEMAVRKEKPVSLKEQDEKEKVSPKKGKKDKAGSVAKSVSPDTRWTLDFVKARNSMVRMVRSACFKFGVTAAVCIDYVNAVLPELESCHPLKDLYKEKRKAFLEAPMKRSKSEDYKFLAETKAIIEGALPEGESRSAALVLPDALMKKAEEDPYLGLGRLSQAGSHGTQEEREEQIRLRKRKQGAYENEQRPVFMAFSIVADAYMKYIQERYSEVLRGLGEPGRAFFSRYNTMRPDYASRKEVCETGSWEEQVGEKKEHLPSSDQRLISGTEEEVAKALMKTGKSVAVSEELRGYRKRMAGGKEHDSAVSPQACSKKIRNTAPSLT